MRIVENFKPRKPERKHFLNFPQTCATIAQHDLLKTNRLLYVVECVQTPLKRQSRLNIAVGDIKNEARERFEIKSSYV